MPDFTRILCAVDYSDASRRALDCALWWARWHGADVSVLHVHPQAPPAPGVTVAGLDAAAAGVTTISSAVPVPLGPQDRIALAESLEEFVVGSRTDGVQVELLVDESPGIADAVLARAAALACDLIVMSITGDRSNQDQPVLGRETAAVLRGASCAVLCVPAPVAGDTNPCFAGLHRIVCPVSFSEPSRQALALAGALAAQATAHLTVMHVVELSEVAASAYDFDAYREARIEPACEQITTVISETVGTTNAIDEIVVTGSPETEILKAARDHDANLIVLGPGASPATAGGSGTLEKVVRDTPCPVLVTSAGPLAAVETEPVLTAIA